MTRAQLLADVKSLIGPSVEVSDVGLIRWINEAYMTLVDEISENLNDYFSTSSSSSLFANQQEYTLPSNLEKIIAVNVNYAGSFTDWQKALPMQNINQIPVISNTTSSQGFSTSTPFYYLYDNEIGLMPIPGASVDSGLKIYYTYTPSEMENDSDIPAIPTKYHHIIKYSVYANYLDQDDEHVAAERMRQRFDMLSFRMVENLSQRQLDEPKSVLITQNQDMYLGNGDY